MSETRQLKVVISGDSTRARSSLQSLGVSLDGVDGKAQKTSSGLSSFGRKAGAVLAGAAAAGAAALGSAGASALVFGLKTAAGFEQLEVSFGTLLKSNGKAKQEMAWLKEKAAATPFELNDLASADRTLLGFGFSVDETRKNFLMSMGEMAAAVGLPSSRLPDLSRIFGQVHAAGVVSMEDINQLIDNGVPIWDMLTAATGKNVQGLRKEIEARKLSADTFESATQTYTKSNFAGAMEKQSQTLTGLWSSLKDNLSIAAAEMVKPLIPLIKDLMPKLADGAKAAGDFINTTLVPAITKFKNEWQSGMSGTDASQIKESLKAIGDAFTKLAPALQKVSQDGPGLNDVMSVTKEVFKFAADNADLLAKALPYLVAGFVLVKTAQLAGNVAQAASIPLRIAEVAVQHRLTAANLQLAAATRASATATKSASTAQATETAAQNGGILARARAVLSMAAQKVATAALSVATKAWAASQWLINAAMSANPLGLIILAIVALVGIIAILWIKNEGFRKAVIAVWNAIKGAVLAVVDWFKTAIPAAWDWVKNKTSAVFNGIKDFFAKWGLTILMVITGPIGWIVGLVIKYWDQIKAFTLAAWNAIVSAVMTVIDFVVNFVKLYFTNLFAFWSAIWNGIVSAAKAAWKWIKDLVSAGIAFVKNYISGVIAGIKIVWSTAWAWISGKVSAVWNGIKSLVSAGINFVKNYISWVVNGIKTTWSNVWNGISGFVSGAWSKIKKAVSGGINGMMDFVKGIPGKITGVFSKLGDMLFDSGKSIIQGLIDGITNMAGNVKDAVKGVLKKARDLLPFSPAKEGPFSGKGWTLYSGQSISEGFAQGITNRGPVVRKAIGRVMSETQSVMSDSNPGTLATVSLGSAQPAGGISVTVNVSGTVTAERDLVKAIALGVRDEIARNARRNGGKSGL